VQADVHWGRLGAAFTGSGNTARILGVRGGNGERAAVFRTVLLANAFDNSA
jgi:hypothetical protein